MAWQLHYTSARSGPTGRAGFQFVATTPGMPAGWEAATAPYLVYQPPSGTAPDAFGYDVVDGHALLVRCRYLGRDYSGRQGNFFGHAVVATPEELEGLRPIELWGSPVWSARDAAELDELVPGETFNPDALGRWFGSTGAYTLLAAVLDAVVRTLRRGHGRIVLVGEDAETVARWIALVSYSLPESVAGRLSFLTYSADPESAPYRLVGTVPEVWEALHSPHSTAFYIDPPRSHDAGSATGFGSVAAGCWRALDLDGLDTIGELAQRIRDRDGTDVLDALEVAACAVSVEKDVEEPDIGASDDLDAVTRAVAACLAVGRPIPTARVADAVASRVRWGDGDLMGALLGIPAEGREPVVRGALAGLERAAEDVRLKTLSDPVCDLLHDHAGRVDWLDTPAAALAILASVGRRRPGERLAITRTLVAMADLPERAEAVTAALAEIWSGAADDNPGGSGWSGLRARLRGGREG